MTVVSTRLLALADAYARAAADREAARELAAWHFADCHTALVSARGDLAAALGIPADALPPLANETTADAKRLLNHPAAASSQAGLASFRAGTPLPSRSANS